MSSALPPWRGDNLTERSHYRRVEPPRSEQLDLFADNRRTIRLNQAHEALGCLDLAGAMASYDKIVQAGLDDREIRDEVALVAAWQERLARCEASDRSAGEIHELYLELTATIPSSLRIALLELMMEELSLPEAPELLFIPPRFPPGLLYFDLGRYDEAREWFVRTPERGIQPAGRFPAYRGMPSCSWGTGKRRGSSTGRRFMIRVRGGQGSFPRRRRSPSRMVRGWGGQPGR
jgi:tetratricopeptide (TPR) repeat protein